MTWKNLPFISEGGTNEVVREEGEIVIVDQNSQGNLSEGSGHYSLHESDFESQMEKKEHKGDKGRTGHDIRKGFDIGKMTTQNTGKRFKFGELPVELS